VAAEWPPLTASTFSLSYTWCAFLHLKWL